MRAGSPSTLVVLLGAVASACSLLTSTGELSGHHGEAAADAASTDGDVAGADAGASDPTAAITASTAPR